MNEADLQLFVRIAALGSLSAAAREGGLSAAVVSHRLAQFEKNLGARLFHRSTRALALTEEGRAFLNHAETLLDAMTTARAALIAPGRVPAGSLRITASASFGRQHLSPLLGEFLARYPMLSISLDLSDQVVDLVHEGYDMGIRVAPSIEPGLVARRLAHSERVLCASPAYLAMHGVPAEPGDLKQHACLIMHDQKVWKFLLPDGTQSAIRVDGPLRSNHGESLREAALAGVGICIQSVWNIHHELASGALQPVLASFPLSAQSTVWAVYPSSRLLAPKVRAFIDFLVARWEKPAWEAATTADGR